MTAEAGMASIPGPYPGFPGWGSESNAGALPMSAVMVVTVISEKI